MPNSYILLNSVTDFIGASLSECSTSGSCQYCSPITLRCISAAAFPPFSASWSSPPTALQLYILEQIAVVILAAYRRQKIRDVTTKPDGGYSHMSRRCSVPPWAAITATMLARKTR